MKRILLLIACIVCLWGSVAAQTTPAGARRLSSGSAVPTRNCLPGPPYTDFYFRTTTHVWYYCSAANTWSVWAVTATSITDSGLTSGRVPFASTGGLLVDDADLTFATDTLTATKIVASTSFSGPTLGVTTNSNACAGCVGEEIRSEITFANRVSLTSSTFKTITSISLPAGDYEVFAKITFYPAGTTSITEMSTSISTTDNAKGTADQSRFTDVSLPASVLAGSLGYATQTTSRVSLASTTTIYLVGYSTFSVSTMQAFGIIRARRVE